jgi:hypothetical protein
MDLVVHMYAHARTLTHARTHPIFQSMLSIGCVGYCANKQTIAMVEIRVFSTTPTETPEAYTIPHHRAHIIWSAFDGAPALYPTIVAEGEDVRLKLSRPY